MTGTKSSKEIVGYVSAYLKQMPRSLADAERDHEAQQHLDEEAKLLRRTNVPREAAKKPPS